jgi:energy-coupling factor transport system permease protein
VTYVKATHALAISPVAQLAVVCLELVPVLLSYDPWTPLPFVALAFVHTVALGRVPVGRFLAVVLPLASLPLGLFVMNLLFTAPEPGDRMVSVLFIAVRERALERASILALRSLALIMLSVGYMLTTDPLDLVNALMQQAKLSPRVGFSLYVAWNTIPLLREDLRRIDNAHRIRLRGRRRNPGEALAVAITLLAGAIRHAERAALSMSARGLEQAAGRTFLNESRWRPKDTAFVAFFALLSAGVLVLLVRSGLFVFGLG